MSKISVVINTLNVEEKIGKLIKSLKWADEVLICDMRSDDKTAEIAKNSGARVVFHKRLPFVEPARNFAVSEAAGEWILILDPDERVSSDLSSYLRKIADGLKQIDYVRVPRKNIIFGRFMKASMWWPDYNIRFFKKGSVKWTDQIHKIPEARGEGLDFPAEEKFAIIHHHYESISQFLEKMLRYTTVQSNELLEQGYKFDWKDLLRKPLGEFLSRFFANRGFEDGLHGLTLSFLQAFSFLVVYLKVWEAERFKSHQIAFDEAKELFKQAGRESEYWLKYGNLSKDPFKRFIQKVKNKF